MSAALVSLGDLARRIDDEHRAATGAARTAIEHAIACGKLLLEAKAGVSHGGWLDWLRANTALSVRQSQDYMRLAQNADALPAANARSTAHLTIDGALKLLAEPKPPREPKEPWPERATPRPEPSPAAQRTTKAAKPAEPEPAPVVKMPLDGLVRAVQVCLDAGVRMDAIVDAVLETEAAWRERLGPPVVQPGDIAIAQIGRERFGRMPDRATVLGNPGGSVDIVTTVGGEQKTTWIEAQEDAPAILIERGFPLEKAEWENEGVAKARLGSGDQPKFPIYDADGSVAVQVVAGLWFGEATKRYSATPKDRLPDWVRHNLPVLEEIGAKDRNLARYANTNRKLWTRALGREAG